MYPKFPTFRSSLLRLHFALLQIEEQRSVVDSNPCLSKFEELVLLLEDRRFLTHYGVDWRSVAREIGKAALRKRHGGASTIDMQLFRTASHRYERTARRKIREVVGVLALQRKFTKIEILRIYLRVAYFGTGLEGSLAAAKAMFPEYVDPSDYKLDESKLTVDQLAQLASLLVYPKPRIPNADWRTKVRRRADYGVALFARREQRLEKIDR